jgi:cytosine/adenosine deaminase-related metal-dependent hydrolase
MMILIERGTLSKIPVRGLTDVDGRLNEWTPGYLAVEDDRIVAVGAGDAPDE